MPMTEFAWTGPLLLTLVKSVVLLVVLLIFIAYVLYADRKIWAAVQLWARGVFFKASPIC
jgi:NADH-quinone oxidoreductase subunit H